MIFRQWRAILDGSKTQTRRLVKPSQESNRWDIETEVINEVIQWLDNGKEYPGNMRSPYAVGYTYAVQRPDKKSVGRIRITKIRRERLEDISGEDCIAEGANEDAYSFIDETIQTLPGVGTGPVRHYRSLPAAFAVLWDSICGPGAWDRMKDSDVWVLDFELVEE